MSYYDYLMLDNGTVFGFNKARHADYEDDCLIICDANGGRVSLCETEVDNLYIFLEQFRNLILERHIDKLYELSHTDIQ